ncbi:hypothetical protein MKK88_07240 [Methylobacterium sp. E-005]|uniref:hypothetical protein n=1 Tax=Methylobacterium sp. E-005 TaxID=2836549 RepID=UPI001FB94447|nr:hypothetical protein [Methylobacterium sp. E-005]MCJ2085789.1 hypothetical protein [Methylobacterium sp. E-005]
MTVKPFRMLLFSRSDVSASGTTQHTVTITAKTKEEAIELAKNYCFSQPSAALCSAKLIDDKGEVVWWMQASGTSDLATPRKDQP